MAKEGYQLVSLKNTNITIGTAVTIPGVYEAIEGNYRKPIVLSDIVVGGVEYANRWVNFSYYDAEYLAVFGVQASGSTITTLYITVSDEDSVKIATTVTGVETKKAETKRKAEE